MYTNEECGVFSIFRGTKLKSLKGFRAIRDFAAGGRLKDLCAKHV